MSSVYQQITQLLPSLSVDEQERLKQWLIQNPNITLEELVSVKEKQGICCPECGQATTVVKYGRTAKGVQRYHCKECDCTFTPMSYTLLTNTKKDISTWLAYVQCMVDGLSLQKAADRCGICIRTAFFWRHKLLDAIRQKLKRLKLKSVVEADDTFIRASFKGNEPIGHEAYKRGSSASKPGVSDEQICISTAIDSNGKVFGEISARGRASSKEIKSTLGKHISKEAILCTDNDSAYKKFAREKHLEHVVIDGESHTNGIYNIQRINNFHSRLKQFMRRFHGVSTKYLDNYLAWMSSIEQLKLSISQVIKSVVKEDYFDRWWEVKDRPVMPV